MSMITLPAPIAPWANASSEAVQGADHITRAMQAAKLDWSVSKVPLICYDNQQETGRFAIRRSTDNRILGVVGTRFTPLQNSEAFASFQPFLDAGEAKIDTCGQFENGGIVWILAKINRDPMVIRKGDEVEKFVLLSHGHNGSMAVRFGFTPIRVICKNTLTMAHKSRSSELIRVRHSQQVVSNVTEIQGIMNMANATFEATAEQYRYLASRDINTKDLHKFARKVLGFVPDGMTVSKKTGKEKGADAIAGIISRFEGGLGNDLQGVRGTWWAAYNGVTEYLTYAAGRSAEDRMASLWTGAAARTSNKAFDMAMTMAQ
jgi:phage/plasmid-like protein (TIGR03299 family)